MQIKIQKEVFKELDMPIKNVYRRAKDHKQSPMKNNKTETALLGNILNPQYLIQFRHRDRHIDQMNSQGAQIKPNINGNLIYERGGIAYQRENKKL